MLFLYYLTVPVYEFRHFVVRKKKSWENGDITDPVVLINDAESKFRSLQEDKLWVTYNPMKAKMLALTTVIGNLQSNWIQREPRNNSINILVIPNLPQSQQETMRSTTHQNLENRLQKCSKNS